MPAPDIISFFKSFDKYGHPIGLNFQNDSTYKTKVGALVSFGIYAMVIVHIITLLEMFYDGSR